LIPKKVGDDDGGCAAQGKGIQNEMREEEKGFLVTLRLCSLG
jgi:hypothetical protein